MATQLILYLGSPFQPFLLQEGLTFSVKRISSYFQAFLALVLQSATR